MFTATLPFSFYLAIPHHPTKLLVAVGGALMFFGLLNRNKIYIGDRVIVVILLTQIIYSFIAALLHEFFFLGLETVYINMAIQYMAIIIVYLYTNTFYSILKIGKSTVYIMVIMGVMGSLAFFLGAAGLLRVTSDWDTFDGSTGMNWILTFSKNAYFSSNAVIIRIAGFFDEPGTFAFYLTFALLTNKLYHYSKKMEILLIISGLFTLSLAFYITLVFYFLLFYGNIRYFKEMILSATVILTVVLYINSAQDKSAINYFIYRETIGRLQPASEGSDKIMIGDNRSDLFRDSWSAFKRSPIIGHGMLSQSNPQSEFYNRFLGANLFSPLAQHGLLGTMFFFMHYFYFSFIVLIRQKRLERNSFAAWVIVTVNLFQRPIVFGGIYAYFVIIILIEATKDWIAVSKLPDKRLAR